MYWPAKYSGADDSDHCLTITPNLVDHYLPLPHYCVAVATPSTTAATIYSDIDNDAETTVTMVMTVTTTAAIMKWPNISK